MARTSYTAPVVASALIPVVSVHCLAIYGLLHMTMPAIDPIKITPPIEVQILTKPPVIEPVVEPKPVVQPQPKPETKPTPKVEKAPPPKAEPKKIMPKKEVVQEIPKPEPIKQETPKQEVLKPEPIKPIEPKPTPKEDVVEVVKEVAVKEVIKETPVAVEKLPTADEIISVKDSPKAVDARPATPATPSQKPTTNHSTAGQAPTQVSNQKQTATAKQTGDGQPATITQSNLYWLREPNLLFNDAEEFRPKVTTIKVTLQVNEKGVITHIDISSTGDKSLDREVKNRLKKAKLHPYTQNGRGVPARGIINITLSGFVQRGGNKKAKAQDTPTATDDTPQTIDE